MFKSLRNLLFRSELAENPVEQFVPRGDRRAVAGLYNSLILRIRELEERVDTEERIVKGLKLEWAESYDKLEHLMARITKRKKKELEERETEKQETTSADEWQAEAGYHDQMEAMRRRNRGH